ncbi:MAG: SUMF1/EgtB/PvdO family nonheme iron enzyme, partial [Candidatus Brocadiae bacterium]|nr:SUMF1/EgtB/PvdO family nonheme iron enzyme [Candidatus Brocadiia bacterium]
MIQEICDCLEKQFQYPREKYETLRNLPTLSPDRKVWEQAFQEFLASRDAIPEDTALQKKWVEMYQALLARFQRIGWYGEAMPDGIEREENPPFYRSPKDKARMAYIPPGAFILGSDPKQDSQANTNETQYKEVNLDGYYMDTTPVTIGQYARFMEDSAYRGYLAQALEQGGLPEDRDYIFVWRDLGKIYNRKFSGFRELCKILQDGPEWWKEPNHAPQGWKCDENHPVVGITWWEALGFALWSGKTLPSEAQWEKAAKGGKKIPVWKEGECRWEKNFHRIYTWGNKWEENKINCAETGIRQTSSVEDTRFDSALSAYGCKDMLGNVWEWCQDWYDENFYKTIKEKNPVCIKKSSFRVCRGG